jgi:hypothetical protein
MNGPPRVCVAIFRRVCVCDPVKPLPGVGLFARAEPAVSQRRGRH